MNLFILDNDLEKCAQYHVDKHVVKMILEAAQLLCTAHWVTTTLGHTPRAVTREEKSSIVVTPEFYGLTHYNHPCAIWTRSSFENWAWTFNYALALNDEYSHRYGKSHKSIEVINRIPFPSIDGGLTPFAQAMPDQYKNTDPVAAYRAYYVGEKSALFSWKNRDKPEWASVALNGRAAFL